MTIDQLVIKEKADKVKSQFDELNKKLVNYNATIDKLVQEKSAVFEKLVELRGKYNGLTELLPQEEVKFKKEVKAEEVKKEEPKEKSKK